MAQQTDDTVLNWWHYNTCKFQKFEAFTLCLCESISCYVKEKISQLNQNRIQTFQRIQNKPIYKLKDSIGNIFFWDSGLDGFKQS